MNLMSSIIYNELIRIGSVENARHITVDRKHGESLADYVRRIRAEKNLSLTDVERNSARRGEKIAGSYVSRIENGVADPEGVTPKKLVALAAGLEVSLYEVLSVAIGAPLESDERFNEEKEQIWEMYTDIPRQCQKDVMDLLAVLQRNHSISARKVKHADRRRVAASLVRVADPVHPPGWEDEGREGEEPILPAAKNSRRA